MQSCNWCFTLNNYTDADIAHLRALPTSYPSITWLIFGREVAESGTPHLQGFVQFTVRKRLQTVRNIVSLEAHFERAIGTPYQASEYCKKDGAFETFGAEPPNIPSHTGAAGHWANFTEWVISFHRETGRAPTARDGAPYFPALFGRNRTGCLSLIDDLLPLPSLQSGELRSWQIDLNNDLHQEADDRTVRFIVDQEGGKGKSFFVRWFYTNNNNKTQLLGVGKIADIAYALDVSKNVFLFNVPRSAMQYLQYPVLEAIKDRHVFSTKFGSMTKVFPQNNHVVILCNEEPDFTKMTEDRYNVTYI